MRWTIRAKLSILVLVVLLPLVAGAAFKFWADLDEGQRTARQETQRTAQAVARLLDEVLSGQIENLLVLAGAHSLDRIHDDDLAILRARIHADHPFIHRIVAATPDGFVTASSGPRVPESIGAFTDPAVLAAVLEQREPRVGPLQLSPTDQRLVVPLVAPVVDRQGAALGVVAAEIDLEALSVFLERSRRTWGASTAIVASDGTVLARSGTGLRSAPLKLSSAVEASALLERRVGVAEWRWEDGVVRLTGAAPIAKAPWVVIAAVPRDQAYGSAAARLETSLLGLALVTFAALLAAWLISRRMSASVRALTEGARGLAAGDGPPVTVSTHDELGELAEQFNRAIEERRAARIEIEGRQRRLRTLGEVTLALSQLLDAERLLQQITQALAYLTGAHNVVLWEADHAARTLIRRAFTADASIASMDLPARITFDEGGTGWIAHHRQPLFIEDVRRDSRVMAVDWALQYDLVAFAGVPVLAGDDLLGVLTFNLKPGRLPESEDRALLSSFASQAAVAIRNARLFAEAERRRHEAEALAGLGRTIARALDPDVVAQQIADGIRALLRTSNSGLYRIEPGSGSFVAVAASGDVGPRSRGRVVFAPGTGVVGLALRERQAVATPNLLKDARVRLSAEHRQRLEQAPYRSVLAVPLSVKDRIIGALAVGDSEGRVFGGDEIRLAQAFADQAALALENARLYAEATRRQREAEELAHVSRMLTETLDVTSVA
ncbi:MAG TPA: GAF domain-containing protein, partial [Methylomirabilota bacterium]|nr:GAF domain-containing protein [Methylomirabilota bacterium]